MATVNSPRGSRYGWVIPLLVVLLIAHTAGAVWCLAGGMQAAESDRRHFEQVAGPLKSAGDMTAQGYESYGADVQKRSAIHAGVMYTYAVVHLITAGALAAALVTIRSQNGRERPAGN